jgi:hypothetical protein
MSGVALAADEPATPPPATQASNAETSSTPPAANPRPADRPVERRIINRAVVTSARNNSDYEVRRMFCLNMSMQCFSVQQDVTANNSNGSIRRLDLHAPDIRRVVNESELHEPVKDEYELMEETEQVEVEGQRPEVYVPGGLLSLPWAVMHPTQAWRIFLPVSSN